MPKKISQAQLAKELGLSQALVSQALNGTRRYCSAETYLRIWRHASKRGYGGKGIKASAAPSALRASVSKTVLHQAGRPRPSKKR